MIDQQGSIPDLASTLIALTARIGRVAAMDPNLSPGDARRAIETLQISIDTYGKLVQIGRNGTVDYLVRAVMGDEARRNYNDAKHCLGILQALHREAI